MTEPIAPEPTPTPTPEPTPEPTPTPPPEPTPTPTPEPTPTSFYDSLSDESRADASAEKFKGADSDKVFKMYRDAQSQLGKKGIIQPNKEDEADVARYRSEMGIPDSADKYELNAPTEFTEKHGYNQDFMRNTALKWGLTEEQATGVEGDYLEDSANTIARQEANKKDAIGKAEQESRSKEGEDYEANTQMAERVIDNFSEGDEEFAKEMKDAMKANPKLRSMLAKQGGQFAEHRIGNFDTPQDVASRDAAKTERSEIMAADKKTHPYWTDKDSVAHQEAIDRMTVLNKMIGDKG